MTKRPTRAARATLYRDALLPLLKQHGHVNDFGLGWTCAGWGFCVRTPFLGADFGNSNRNILAQQGIGPKPKTNGLDIWRSRKVVSMEWGTGDEVVRLISFRAGPWEDELIALVAGLQANEPCRQDKETPRTEPQT